MKKYLLLSLLLAAVGVKAQVGVHRNDFSVGVNGGYALSNVSFVPSVPQSMHGGLTGGLSFRYTCEKYFSTVCSVMAEVNYSQIGWKEKILDINDEPVINNYTLEEERFSHTINYLQVPIFAHLAWGRERSGLNFFFHIGPQFGIYLSESTDANYDLASPNIYDRVSPVTAQETMDVENKFDYGIAGGLGVELSNRHVGHFLLEGRYYFGLGNMYGDSKRDYFARSNFGNIVVKLSWLFDIVRTKDDKIK